MPQPSKIPLAFAASGDKNVIPESTETTGLASWREGFPAITSAPFSEGGIAPKRADFNGIFNALSQSVIWLQQGGVYAYDVNTDYEAGNVVLDAGGLYVANAGNGPSSVVVQPSTDATGATWKLVRLDLATQIAAGYMSAADKNKLDGLISTDATQTAAGYMSAEDKTVLDGVPTTYLPLSGGTMTGNLSVNGLQLTGTKRIYGNNTSDVVRMSGGGTDATDGASIALYGAGQSWSGHFFLQAKNASDSIGLHGYPNGTLLWGSKDVVRAESSASGKMKLSDGTMIQWGKKASSTSAVQSVTFGEAFYDNNVDISVQFISESLSSVNNDGRSVLTSDFTKTGFSFTALGITSNKVVPVQGNCSWIAIGRWKA